MSEHDGRIGRRVNCSRTHTCTEIRLVVRSSFSLSLSLYFSNDPKNRRRNITGRVLCIYLLQLASDQLYVQTRNGGKIVRWREHGMAGEEREKRRNDINMRCNHVGIRENKVFTTDNVDTDIVECFWRKKR